MSGPPCQHGLGLGEQLGECSTFNLIMHEMICHACFLGLWLGYNLRKAGSIHQCSSEYIGPDPWVEKRVGSPVKRSYVYAGDFQVWGQ